MPRKSFKQAVSTDAQELLGFSLLIDLCFNAPEEEDLGCGDGDHLEVSRINGALVKESEINGVSVIAEDIEELCEMLLIAIPNIRYLAPRVSLPRGIGFWSNLITISEDRFCSLFRMTPPAFYTLNEKIKYDPIFKNQSRNPQADTALQLAITLYILGQKGNSTIRFSEQLQIGEGTASLYRYRSMVALLRLLPTYLIWPQLGSSTYRLMRSEIEDESNFPGCIGFLDGTDIGLMYAPSFYGETYMNRKKRYALNIQTVCDNNLRFTFISAGYPASVGDPVAFGSTPLFRNLASYFFSPDEYLLGDKIYRITRRCMTPYKEPLASQPIGGYKYFNWMHAHARIKIEHAIGVLKNRFRSLQQLPIYIRKKEDHTRALCWIMTCIVLHNFLNQEKEDSTVYQPHTAIPANELELDEVDEEIGVHAERVAGLEWRDRMRLYLYQHQHQ